VPALVEACQDSEIPRWTRVPSPYSESDARAFLESSARERAEGRAVHLAVVDAGIGSLLGSIGLVRVASESGAAELGYWVAAPARGRGVATRAVRLLSRWALDSLRLSRLHILAEPRNLASQRVAERAGFTRERSSRLQRELKGTAREYLLFCLRAGGHDGND
jgi:RimJ/RimL family protein N-acetyltransferase